MRSYDYREGKWTPVKDTLPPTVRKPARLLTETEPRKQYQRYTDALQRLGFATDGTLWRETRLGRLTIRGRDHAQLPMERLASETYDFLCELFVAGSYVRVWIEDLPTLHFFLTDVQAERESEQDDTLREFLESERMRNVLANIDMVLDDLREGVLEITVKSPKR